MSLAGDVIKTVIGERSTLSEPPSAQALEATVKRAEHLIASGLEVSVQVLLVTDDADGTDGHGQAARVLEVWTVQPCVSNDQGQPPMMPLFLKNAIRSHLHFSPIKSWASSHNDKLPKRFRCAYRLSTTSAFIANGCIVQKHSFPPCRTAEDQWLKISVQWLNKDDWAPRLTADAMRDGVGPPQSETDRGSPLLASTPRSEKAYEDLLQSKRSPSHGELAVAKTRRADETTAPSTAVPLNRTQSEHHDDDVERRKQSKREARIRRNTTGSSFVETPTTRRMPLSASFCGFNPKTKLPINSSPAPTKRAALDLAKKLKERCTVYDDSSGSDSECVANTSPGSASLNTGLLCNFEESVLNGRLDPVGEIDGFQLQIAATGAFCIPHLTLPVKTSFFHISDDDTPSLYLGQCSLEDLSRKALHIPKKCTFQATLFNPQGSVVKIFIARIDVSDMPAKSRTFVRQRTLCVINVEEEKKRYLRYLIHLRLATDRRGRLYLHTDIRMLFSNKNDVDLLVGTDGADDSVRFSVETERPKYSPAK